MRSQGVVLLAGAGEADGVADGVAAVDGAGVAVAWRDDAWYAPK